METLWKRPKLIGSYKRMLIGFREEPAIIRVEKPTRPDRARRVGYKAKQGFAVVRARVPMGRRKRPKISGGRRPKTFGRFFSLDKSKQQVAEEKVGRKYPNMEVVNSYWVGEDGVHKWFEVILADRSHPAIKKDKTAKIVAKRGRPYRGLTSAGKKSRGLRK